MTQTDIEMAVLEQKAREVGVARHTLSVSLGKANAELAKVREKHAEVLRDLTADFKAKQTELEELVGKAPALFDKPQSQEISGVKFGWRKGKGRLVLPEADKLLKKIGEVLTRSQKESVVKVKVTILKGALAKLSGDLLKKLGIDVVGAGPEPFVSFPKSPLAKQVDWWLKPIDQADDEDE